MAARVKMGVQEGGANGGAGVAIYARVSTDDKRQGGCPISCVSSSRDALYVVGGSRTWHERSGTR
jgi:hypothetical protein